MIFVPTVNLVVQEKIVEHSLQACELSSFEPGEHVGPERHVHPFAKALWFRDSHFAELGPDGNTGIRREDVWGKADIGELAAYIAHGLKGDDAVGFRLSGIAEDQVEGDTDAAELCLACGLVHLVDTLVALVHQLED